MIILSYQKIIERLTFCHDDRKSNILSQLSNVGSIKKEIISLLIVFFSFVWDWVGKERNTIKSDIIVIFYVSNND